MTDDLAGIEDVQEYLVSRLADALDGEQMIDPGSNAEDLWNLVLRHARSVAIRTIRETVPRGPWRMA